MENAQPLEIMPQSQAEESPLIVTVRSFGLPIESLQTCLSRFQRLLAEAKATIEQASKIAITEASTPLEVKLVRTLRMALKDVRCRVENERKALKEESITRGKAIEGMANIVKAMIEPVEKSLEDQEKFKERQEAARKQALKEEREAQLRVYAVDPQFYNLAEMTAEAFAQLMENTKIAHAAKIEAARKAEADRIAAENARLAEEARVREENARLKREAAEREEANRMERQKAEADAKAAAEVARKEREAIEAKACAEREALEKKAREDKAAADAAAAKAKRESDEAAAKEREARQKAEAELKASKEAEAKRQADEEKARRKAENAPKAQKLRAFATLITDEVPNLGGDPIQLDLGARVLDLRNWIISKADNI
jgi:hypothetical protein